MGKFDDPGDFPPEATEERPKAPVVAEIRPSTPLRWRDLAGREPPARRWVINGWLGYGHTTLLVGSGGIGKTLIAQQLGSALALGVPQYIDDIPAPARVLMWACEDDHDELWRRQVQIARYFDAGLDAFAENLYIVPRAGHDNVVASTEFGKLQFTGLERHLAEQVKDYKADLVILDNAAQTYGGNENDRHSVTVFLNGLSGFLGRERALLLLAHPSRAQGSEFSGSGAWENVARTRLYLGPKLPGDTSKPTEDAPEAEDCRYLCRRKGNYSAKDWRRFTLQNGVLVPDQASGGLVASIRADQALDIVLKGLQSLTDKGLEASEGGRSPNYLPKLLLEYKLGGGRNRSELSAAMRALILDGRITKTIVGRNSNRNPRYGLQLAL